MNWAILFACLYVSRYIFVLKHSFFKNQKTLNNFLDRLLKKIERYALDFSRRLKPFPLESINTNIEVHTLLTSRDVSMYLWAIRSLMYYSHLKCPVVVHDDGQLTSEDYAIIQRSLPGVRILNKDEADRIVKDKLNEYPLLLEYRKQNILTLKIFDFNLTSSAEKIISFDSDILFFKSDQELIESFNSPQREIIFNCEYESTTYSKNKILTGRFPYIINGFNSGLMCYQRKEIEISEVNAIVEWIYANRKHLTRADEQVIYAILAGRKKSKPLSKKYCASPHLKLNNDLACRHYHSTMKYAFALQGIKKLLKHKPEFIEEY